MEVIAAAAAYALDGSSPQQILSKLGLASLFAGGNNFLADLRPELSSNATIFLPSDANFANLTSRWREWHAPTFAAVVQPASESDVQITVRYANEHGIPFVARSGGHGATEALASAKDAIQIDFRNFNEVKVSEDGKTATIGGGATVKEVTARLAEAGKQAVTGVCECVGVSAPILGGGHGWLQGQYGLLTDQVISARIVLPNGNAMTVSEAGNSDLFWALRGAGHNFGLVTEWEYKIYDIKNAKWSYEIFVFSGDKLEALYELTNKRIASQPPEVTHLSYIISVPEVDSEHPVIWYIIIADGPVDRAREYAKPLHDVGPLTVEAGEATLHELAVLTFMDMDGPSCAKGFTSIRYPLGLTSYNTTAVRKVYDEIDETFRRVPELRESFFLLEGYSTQGVQGIDAISTAFPHRVDGIVTTSFIKYKPNTAIDPIAQAFGKKMRTFLLEGSEDPEHPRAYVNYAHGDEPLQEVYGWDEWRLERLKKLKKEWDPENRMRYYVPII